jgi:hypothetical protein
MPYLTLTQVLNQIDEKGAELEVAEILAMRSPLIKMMPMVEATHPAENQSAEEAGLPEGTSIKRINQGVTPSVGNVEQIKDAIVTFERHITIDNQLLTRASNPDAIKRQQIRLQTKKIAQDFANEIIYGDNDTNPDDINGINPRLNTLGTDNFDTTDPFFNVMDGGGAAADNASIILLNLDPDDGVRTVYTPGTKAGVEIEKKSDNEYVQTGTGSALAGFYATMYALKTNFGLVVPKGACVRIANIKTSTLTMDESAGALLIDLLQTAKNVILNRNNLVAITTPLVKNYLEGQLRRTTNFTIPWSKENMFDLEMSTVFNFPIVAVEDMSNAEATVT